MTTDEFIKAWYKEATQVRPDCLASHFRQFAVEHKFTIPANVPWRDNQATVASNYDQNLLSAGQLGMVAGVGSSE